ncbi:hypothetical protein PC115_g25627, partial [Phytophthora cactorum]
MNRTWRIDGGGESDQLRYAIGFDDIDVSLSGQVTGMISDPNRTIVLLGSWTEGERTLTGHEFIHGEGHDSQSGVQDGHVQESSAAIQHAQFTTPPMPPKLSGSPELSRVTLTAEQRASSGQPEHFSQYGQDFGYLLYECDFDRPEDGITTLILPDLQDTARIYVNRVEQAL